MLSVCLSILAIASSFALSPADGEAPKVLFTAGYFGELATHPGLSTGVEIALLQGKWHALLVGAQLGGYRHPRNHTALFLDMLADYQLTFPFGLFLDLGLGAGYMHVFLDGPIYEVVDGSVERVPGRGFPRFMPLATLGTGYKFFMKTGLPVAVEFKLGLAGEYPFANQTALHPFFQGLLSYAWK